MVSYIIASIPCSKIVAYTSGRYTVHLAYTPTSLVNDSGPIPTSLKSFSPVKVAKDGNRARCVSNPPLLWALWTIIIISYPLFPIFWVSLRFPAAVSSRNIKAHMNYCRIILAPESQLGPGGSAHILINLRGPGHPDSHEADSDN